MNSSSTAVRGHAMRAAGRGLAVVGLAMLAASLSGPAVAQLMVSGGGSAGYSHTVKVPPGAGGMAPSVALSYTGADLSPVGKGWTIRATSTIARCAAIKSIDGVTGRVNFTTSDKLCLDGMRLIQTDAAGVPLPFPQTNDALWLADGVVREFRTESDSYVRIRAYGKLVSSDSKSPPKYFKAWTKDGRVYEFGPGPNTTSTEVASIATNKPAQAWVLSRVTDVSGNYMAYTYEQDHADACGAPFGVISQATYTMDWRLSRIDYSGNSANGQATQNSVVFAYTSLACDGDQSHAWHMGYARVNLKKLQDVTTYVGTTAASKTTLGYTRSPQTNRSVLSSITECAGAGTPCMPATEFTYTPGSVAFQTNSTFSLDASGQSNGLDLEILKREGSTGVEARGTIDADFNGDGRPDLLVWADNPANNRLYLSEGAGNFRRVTSGTGAGQFNITDENLFISVSGIRSNDDEEGTYSGDPIGYCFETVVADFNGDGLMDLIRTRGREQCTRSVATVVFLSNGDGSFTKRSVLNAADQLPIRFSRVEGTYNSTTKLRDNYGFYLVGDFDRDGRADVLQFAAANNSYQPERYTNFAVCMTYATQCGATFWKGNGDGTFNGSELTWARATGANSPASGQQQEIVPGSGINGYTHYVPFAFKNSGVPYVLMNASDMDGDGVLDLQVGYSVYLGGSDGAFTYVGQDTSVVATSYRGDFNGDRRLDKLGPRSGTQGITYLGWGGNGLNWEIKGYSDTDGSAIPSTTGVPGLDGTTTLVLDVDGDDRSDVLTYHEGGDFGYWRSLGNGFFAAYQVLPGMNVLDDDQSAMVLVGNFTGTGALELLATPRSSQVGNWTNKLVVKTNPTPPDMLVSVKSSTGIVSTVSYVNLTATDRYASDRGTAQAAVLPQVEVTPPMTVVKTLTVDSGVGTGKNVTEFAYKGYKEDQYRVDAGRARLWQIDQRNFQGDDASRRSLGFREVRRQVDAPDGSSKLTSVRSSLQVYPYSGSSYAEESYLGALSAIASPQTGLRLSTAESTYCDQTAAAGAETTATPSAPCASTSKVRRPYLRKSVKTGSDLDGTALPTASTTTTYAGGYPTQVETLTTGTGPAGAQSFTQRVVNEYYADSIGGDNWLLGLVKKSTTTSTVPNSLSSIATSAGTAPKATATSGP